MIERRGHAPVIIDVAVAASPGPWPQKDLADVVALGRDHLQEELTLPGGAQDPQVAVMPR